MSVIQSVGKEMCKMEAIREWAATLIMLVAAGGFLEMALPEGNMKKYASFIFAMIILDLLLSPVNILK